MSIASFADKTAAILRRDLLMALRYRNGFFISIFTALAELAAFYYLARAVGPEYRPEGTDYFLFLLIGTGFFTCFMAGMNGFVRVVQEAQQSGTLEMLMTTSTPGPVLVILSAGSTFVGNFLQFVFYLATGLLILRMPLVGVHALPCLLALCLSLAIAGASGLLAAAVQLAFQKGSAVLWMFGSGAWFLTGALFPVRVLPKPVGWISNLVPLTHCLTAIRLALLPGSGGAQLWHELEILVLFAGVLLPLSAIVFAWTLNHARQQGTLSFY